MIPVYSFLRSSLFLSPINLHWIGSNKNTVANYQERLKGLINERCHKDPCDTFGF